MEPAGGTAPGRSVAGRVAVVTGAASGMGRAIAELFSSEGALVAALDRAEGVPYVVDVSDREAVTSTIGRVRAELGPIDILVNCAGVSVPAPIDADGYDEAWRLTLAVNLEGYVHTIRASLDDLARDGGGRIVNVASTEGLGATAMLSPYTVSKASVHSG